MRRRRRTTGALLCTIANTAVGLLGSACGCLGTFGVAMSALDQRGPAEAAALTAILMGLLAVGHVLLLAGGIFGIVGLAARTAALRRGLLLGAIGSAVALPTSLLGLLGCTTVLLADTPPGMPRGAPVAAVKLGVLAAALFCLLPLVTGIANLRAWLQVRREPPMIDELAAAAAFD